MTVETYQCPACGAPLAWKDGQLVCDNCGTACKEEDMRALSEAMQENKNKSQLDWSDCRSTQTFSEQEMQSLREYACPACGATLLTGAATAATKCAYCGNNALLPEQLSGALRPDAVLPFSVSREQAEKKLHAHFAGKKLLPDDFVRACRVEDVEGLYVPYYLFDCKADARCTYRAQRVHSYRRGSWQITDTHHYYVERCGSASFSRVPVDACKRVDNTLTEAIEPFDYDACQTFDAGYLAGYQADCKDQDVAQCLARVNERVTNSAAAALRDTVHGYTSVVEDCQQVQIKQGKARYVMMPVWLLTVRYGEQAFPFAVNGQTGRLAGELPVDKRKYRLMKYGWMLGLEAALALLIAFFL